MRRESFFGSLMLATAVAGLAYVGALIVVGATLAVAGDHGMRIDLGLASCFLYAAPSIIGVLTLLVLRMREFERRHHENELVNAVFNPWVFASYTLLVFLASCTKSEGAAAVLVGSVVVFIIFVEESPIVSMIAHVTTYGVILAIGVYWDYARVADAIALGCTMLVCVALICVILLSLRSQHLDSDGAVMNMRQESTKPTTQQETAYRDKIERVAAETVRAALAREAGHPPAEVPAVPVEREIDALTREFQRLAARVEGTEGEKKQAIADLLALADRLKPMLDDKEAYDLFTTVLGKLATTDVDMDTISWTLDAPKAQA